MICPHCQKEFNAGKIMGGAKTPAKRAAAKKRGADMKRLYANARKMEQPLMYPIGATGPKFVPGKFESHVDPEFEKRLLADNPALSGIAPKGSFSKDDLKALIAGGPKTHEADKDLHNIPHAPFEFNEPESGEPHRVTQMGKKLALFYLGGGEPTFSRYLLPGELEKYWELRKQ